MSRPRAEQVAWGLLGALAAATFAVWMFLFPGSIAERFAWDVHPRYAQAFIGAGYIFRTAFFLNAAREPDWLRLRWIVWGNLAFTGTLLFATYWHADEFNWNPLQTPLAHFWIILYIFEPVTMLYLIPCGVLAARAPATGGPLHRLTKGFLVLVAGLLLMNGLLLLINPEFAARRWPWELNPLDARISAAWLLGWATWCATMAFAQDWDEVRTAVLLFMLNGAALVATAIIFGNEFLPGRVTAPGYTGWLVAVTILAGLLFLLQERRRPARAMPAAAPVPT